MFPSLAFFDPPTFLYNLLAFLFTVAGIGLAIWALYLAYWQIGEAVTAARAAKVAAEQARSEVQKITTIIDVTKLAQISGKCHDLIRDKKFQDAAVRSQELRSGMAELRETPIGKRILDDSEWEEMAAKISQIKNILDLKTSSEHDDDTLVHCHAFK